MTKKIVVASLAITLLTAPTISTGCALNKGMVIKEHIGGIEYKINECVSYIGKIVSEEEREIFGRYLIPENIIKLSEDEYTYFLGKDKKNNLEMIGEIESINIGTIKYLMDADEIDLWFGKREALKLAWKDAFVYALLEAQQCGADAFGIKKGLTVSFSNNNSKGYDEIVFDIVYLAKTTNLIIKI